MTARVMAKKKLPISDEIHAIVEERPVWTHEFAFLDMMMNNNGR